MTSLIWLSGWRHHLRHPVQLLLCGAGIAMGVAVVLAIDLAIDSSERAFELSLEGVAGRSTHHVVGGPAGVPEDLYRHWRVDLGFRRAAPIVQVDVRIEDPPVGWCTLVGIDPYAEGQVRGWGGELTGGDGPRLITTPGLVTLARSEAARLGVGVGDALRVRVGSREVTLEVGEPFELDTDGSRERVRRLLVADLATVQEILERPGRLTRIDLALVDGSSEERTLEATLPGGCELVTAASRRSSVRKMTAAFSLNLRCLGLLSLVVAMFLIYNAMTFSVVQRRERFGRLRALGVSRRQILRAVLGEALVIALVAMIFGVLGGWALGHGLVQVVAGTIGDLYYAVEVQQVFVSRGTLLTAIGVGVVATLLAALPPALEASRSSVRQAQLRSTLEETRRRQALRRSGLGLLLGTLALVPLGVATSDPAGGYVMLVVIVVAAALMAPMVTDLGGRVATALARQLGWLVPRMATRNVARHLSRTGVAVAALTVALAMVTGIGIMIECFRGAVVDWLGATLRGDVYVSTPGPVARKGSQLPLPAELVSRWRTRPEVESVAANRLITVSSDQGRILLSAIDVSTIDLSDIDLSASDSRRREQAGLSFVTAAESAWDDFETGAGILVSEPFAFKSGLAVGDSMKLVTDHGRRDFPVVGVFLDYASDEGYVILSRAAYDANFDDRSVTALAFFLTDGASPATFRGILEADVDAAGLNLRVRESGRLREASLEIFDRTFAVTSVLRTLAVIVAVVGIVSALVSLQLERRRELALLRAHGFSVPGLGGVLAIENFLLGLTAGVFAMPLGVLFAAVLTLVVNPRSFGWTIPFFVPPWILVETLFIAVATAMVAGIYPSYRMARTSPARALREE